ncbi:MAG: hypothetical protein V7607_3869 [Solirubrobacteraceae bacterium]
MDPTEELARLAVLLLRRSIGTQSEMIAELARVGFGTTRIAELLGTTSNTVNQALVKSKASAKKPGSKQSAGTRTTT